MPRPKYTSTLELVTHVHHENKSDIPTEEVIRTLQVAIADIRDAGSYEAWMELLTTEET